MPRNILNLRKKTLIGLNTREELVSSQQCSSLDHYGMRVVGKLEADETYEIVREDADRSRVLVCWAGEGEVLIDNEWQSCGPGWAYLTPHRTVQAYHSSSKDPWEFCWVYYGGEEENNPLKSMERPQLTRVDPQAIKQAVEGLLHEAYHLSDDGIQKQWVDLIHTQVIRIVTGHAQDNRLVETWGLVQKDLTQNWTLETLSAHANLGKKQFYRLCVQTYGMTPTKRLAALRMRRAEALLGYTQDTIKSICYRVGYEDPFAFSTAFKRVIGVSPSEYRKELSHGDD